MGYIQPIRRCEVKRVFATMLVLALLLFAASAVFAVGESPPVVNGIEMIAMNPDVQSTVVVEQTIAAYDAPEAIVTTMNISFDTGSIPNYCTLSRDGPGYPLRL